MGTQVKSTLKIGSGYFAINDILPLEAILLSPFVCAYTAILAKILAITVALG